MRHLEIKGTKEISFGFRCSLLKDFQMIDGIWATEGNGEYAEREAFCFVIRLLSFRGARPDVRLLKCELTDSWKLFAC